MSNFNPRTYSGLEQMRSGRWCLPGSEELENTDQDSTGELLAELLAPGSGIPGVFTPFHIEYGCHTRVPEDVPVKGNRLV